LGQGQYVFYQLLGGLLCCPPCGGRIWTQRVGVKAGVRQGEVILPLLFNLLVDGIFRNIDFEHPHLSTTVKKVFYADNNRIGGDTVRRSKKSFHLLLIVSHGWVSLSTLGKQLRCPTESFSAHFCRSNWERHMSSRASSTWHVHCASKLCRYVHSSDIADISNRTMTSHP
jgi:hypothetical protein